MKKGLTLLLVSILALGVQPAIARGNNAKGHGGAQSIERGHHEPYRATRAVPSTGRDSTATPAMPGQPKAQAQVLEHRSDSQNLNRATPAVPGKEEGETVPAVPGNEKAKGREDKDE